MQCHESFLREYFGGVVCMEGVWHITRGRYFWHMCTQGVIDLVQHVLAQVLSDELITTKD